MIVLPEYVDAMSNYSHVVLVGSTLAEIFFVIFSRYFMHSLLLLVNPKSDPGMV